MIIEAQVMAPTRHGVPLTTKERLTHEAQQAELRRLDKEGIAEKAKAAGMKKRQIRDADGKIVDVWMFSASYYAMGFNAMQIAAAERFGRDWEVAYRTIKAQTFEPSVDGGGSRHGAHISQVSAQSRLQACEQYLGRRNYEIVRAVVIHGATCRQIHALGGKEHSKVKSDMDVAFNDLDAFYTGTRRKDRTWDAIERFNAERAAMIEQAEREVG